MTMSQQPPDGGSFKSKFIMVFNDTKEVLELFEEILTEEGYRTQVYGVGPNDLEVIKQEMPDLVIVDQMITDESPGWQLIQKMKMNASTAKIPILVCTAAVNIIKQIEGNLKSKNVGIILKPFDIDELIRAVKKALEEPVGGPSQ